MILLLVLIAAVVVDASAPPPQVVVKVVKDYGSYHEASSWITIKLERAGSLRQIDWCRSLIPNPRGPDINACNAPGLMHMRLYPSPVPNQELVRIDSEDPSLIFIDPTTIGGWDFEHQAAIVVQANVNARTVLEQVVRFNPLQPTPSTSTTTTTKKPTETPALVEVVVDTTSGSSSSASVLTPQPPVAQVEAEQHPWFAALLIFGGGSCMLVFVALVVRFKEPSSRWLKRRLSVYRASSLYEFEGNNNEDAAMGGWIELESAKRETTTATTPATEGGEEDEDMALLLKLGSGASPAYQQNL